MKGHKADVHDIDVVWHHCDQPGCTKKFKRAGTLKNHKAFAHDMDVVWHHCDQPGCTDKFKRASHLKRHKADVHDIDAVYHHCDQPGCPQKFKQASTMKGHKADVHDIDVVWHHCDQPGCTKKFKHAGTLKSHKAFAHDINAVWHHCDQPGCTHKVKQAGDLKKHKAYVHDIGEHECDYCNKMRNARNDYEDPNAGTVCICRDCFKKVTGKTSRIELLWSDYVDRELGTEGLLGADDSLRTLGGCSLKRPDKLYADHSLVEVDECDEHQHVGKNYTCEQARLSELYDEPSICGKPMVVIRWNPNGYRGGPKLLREDRMQLFVQLKRAIRAQRRSQPLDHPWPRVVVYYMFYTKTNPGIVKDIVHHFVNTPADLARALAD